MALEPGVARLEREAELVDELDIRGVERADDFAAELDRPSLVDPNLLDAPADAAARLEHGDIRAAAREVAGCTQAGEARAEHEYVCQVWSSRAIELRMSSRACSRSTSPR